MSYLPYLCLFAHSGVQHMLCCVFILFFFPLLTVSLDCSFLLPFRYSLSFIYRYEKRPVNTVRLIVSDKSYRLFNLFYVAYYRLKKTYDCI